MKKYVFIILSLFILSSCEKDEPTVIDIEEGLYKGTFQRELVLSDSPIANISIIFSSNEWSGSSDRVKYPALCHGSYSINRDTIIFINECLWTADFDWSLILSGKYVLVKNGNKIEFTRDYRNATTVTYVDRFVLSKQD